MSVFVGRESDKFTRRAESWIRHNLEELRKYCPSEVFDHAVEYAVFNVLDAYYDLIKYPEQCEGCGRTGKDHDGECEVLAKLLEEGSEPDLSAIKLDLDSLTPSEPSNPSIKD